MYLPLYSNHVVVLRIIYYAVDITIELITEAELIKVSKKVRNKLTSKLDKIASCVLMDCIWALIEPLLTI